MKRKTTETTETTETEQTPESTKKKKQPLKKQSSQAGQVQKPKRFVLQVVIHTTCHSWYNTQQDDYWQILNVQHPLIPEDIRAKFEHCRWAEESADVSGMKYKEEEYAPKPTDKSLWQWVESIQEEEQRYF